MAEISPHELERELLRRRRAQGHLVDYARYTYRGYRPAEHHFRICDALERVERGECKRLMIFMPPRHGKSELASRRFPSWTLGRNPNWSMIAASYNSDLARDFGRDVRNIMATPHHGAVFPNSGLAEDSKSQMRWHTAQGGGYSAAGVGTAVTGRGAHVFLIDDPVKDREAADSQLIRDKTYSWYLSTAYTRLEGEIVDPDEDPLWRDVEQVVEGEKFEGAIVLIQCMTGDTSVLLAEGGEKPLRDIRRGDRVATYENGKLTTSLVVNWVNHGPDDVFAITMKSGTVVKANARHPFLVVDSDGTEEWQKTRQLRPGQSIRRVIGGSTEASHAKPMGANCPQSARGSATPITTRTGGPGAFVRRLLTHAVTATRISSIVTGSTLRNMIDFSTLKAAFVPFAATPQTQGAPLSIGSSGFALTTATIRTKSEDCSATNVTSWFAGQTDLKFSKQPQITSDEIVSVEPCGSEDVFDIQVDRTENFIANGLVSHNTRWHDDDLSGRLLRDMERGADQWEVLSLPGLNDAGEALWPAKYSTERMLQIKATLTPREWRALYQQEPSPDDGDFFKREWFKSHDGVPSNLSIVMTSDFAVSDENSADFTELAVWGLNADKGAFLLDWWSGQETAAVWIEKTIDLMEKWKAATFFGETGVIRRAIEPILRRRMTERDVFCRLEWLTRTTDKSASARGFQGRAEMGMISFPKTGFAEDVMAQLLKFPTGAHDDKVDACALLGMALAKAHPALTYQAETPSPRQADDYGVDRDDDNVVQWKVA